MYPETQTYLLNRLDEIFKDHDTGVREEDSIKTLEHLKKFISNYKKFYVFDITRNWIDITYYKYDFDFFDPNNEDEYRTTYAYNMFLLEVDYGAHVEGKNKFQRLKNRVFMWIQRLFKQDVWNTKYTLYANNDCERECCPTWKIFEYIEK